MSCILLVKNTPNAFRRGEVITVYESESELTEGVDKSLFEAKFGIGSWDRRSVLIFVTDKDKDSPEIVQLLQESDAEGGRRVAYIKPQTSESPYYQELVETARVHVTYLELSEFIVWP